VTAVARYRVDVLGPLRVLRADGTDVTPHGALPRRLVAHLVLRRGRTLSVDAAVEVLWPEERPANPVAALQNHVSRLRRAMPGALGSGTDGYRLDPESVEVDADRLAAAISAPGDEQGAVQLIDDVLGRWRGPAYPELEGIDEARAETLRLDELRVRATELRAARRIAAARTDGLAAELRALVDEHPLREPPRALLIETLAATGRHADALRVFDEFRRLLADELGIDPSPALVARHRELLARSGVADWDPAHRLPTPATSLIGRDDLLRELDEPLATARLVTLVGPGGVGKTRLLLEIGHRLVGSDPSTPVVLAELGRADAATAVEATAAALGIDVRLDTPLPDRIAGVVGNTRVVLLLDNCEHVVEPIAGLVDLLLSRCPGLRIVATSRERLRVAGEQVRVVPPLSADGGDSPAAQLFVERARAAAGDVALDEHTVERVRSIVARLDGLPLAIELAAARMHSHEIEEIAAGLDERFAFLTSGYRTSSRHGSLGAAVDWSFELLDEPLRRMFTDLAVFAGPFELAGAAAVSGLDDATAADRLARLVERSLVMRYPGRRYVLLETLRTYGRDQLVGGGRLDEVGDRHARFTVEWVQRAGRRLALAGSGSVRRIDDAVPELQRALDWFLDHDETEPAGRLVASLFDYGLLRLRPDVLSWAGRVATADPHDRSPLAAEVLAAGAYAAWMAGDLDAAGDRARRALQVAEAADGPVPARVYGAMGVYELFAGRLRESAAWYGRAAEGAASTEPGYWPIPAGTEIMVLGYDGDPSAPGRAEELVATTGDSSSPYAAYAWYCAGEAVLATDPQRARECLGRALRTAQMTDATFVTGIAGASRASLDARLGDVEEAVSAYRWLIRHWQRAGMWSTQWVMLRSIAVLLDGTARHVDAAVLEGAIRGASASQRLTGADEVALDALSDRLRATLGADAYGRARQQGAALDSDALLDHVLRSL
jgi:predicted ATPase/DNA-binding SARP family transcriptional activator